MCTMDPSSRTQRLEMTVQKNDIAKQKNAQAPNVLSHVKVWTGVMGPMLYQPSQESLQVSPMTRISIRVTLDVYIPCIMKCILTLPVITSGKRGVPPMAGQGKQSQQHYVKVECASIVSSLNLVFA